MQWLDYSDLQKKKNILSILIKMIKEDGHFSPLEYRYISLLGGKFGIIDAELEVLMKTPILATTIPSAEPDRMTIMIYILLLMKADRHISRQEEQMIFHYGFRLGFREPMLRDFVLVIKTYSNAKLPPHLLIEKVKTYLN